MERKKGRGDEIKLFKPNLFILFESLSQGTVSNVFLKIISWALGRAVSTGCHFSTALHLLCFCSLRFSLAVKTWPVSDIHAEVFIPVKENQCSLQLGVKRQGVLEDGVCGGGKHLQAQFKLSPHKHRIQKDVSCNIHGFGELSAPQFIC